jgi:molecular chaperone DnaJ
VLGVSEGATQEEIKKAFLILAKKFHPDVNQLKDASKKFSDINEAYETLGD